MQRHLRLRHRADFARLRAVGQTVATPVLVLSVAPNDLPHNRYGVIASRRLGAAVTRNRARRRLREAIRHWHPHLPAGHDMVFIARHRVIDCPYQDILAGVESALRRAGLLVA